MLSCEAVGTQILKEMKNGVTRRCTQMSLASDFE